MLPRPHLGQVLLEVGHEKYRGIDAGELHVGEGSEEVGDRIPNVRLWLAPLEQHAA